MCIESMPRVLGMPRERTGSQEGRGVLLKHVSLDFQFCQKPASIYILLALLSSSTSLPDGCGITCKAACRLFLKKRKFSLKVNESVNFQHVGLKLQECLSELDLCEMRHTQSPLKLWKLVSELLTDSAFLFSVGTAVGTRVAVMKETGSMFPEFAIASTDH